MIPDKKNTGSASILKRTKGPPPNLPGVEDNRSAMTLIDEEKNIDAIPRFKIPSIEFDDKRRNEFIIPSSEDVPLTILEETPEKIKVFPIIGETLCTGSSFMLQIKPTMRESAEEVEETISMAQINPLTIEMSIVVKSNPTTRSRDINLLRKNSHRLEIPQMHIAETGSQHMELLTTNLDPEVVPTRGDLSLALN